jgi:hypothetical protein
MPTALHKPHHLAVPIVTAIVGIVITALLCLTATSGRAADPSPATKPTFIAAAGSTALTKLQQRFTKDVQPLMQKYCYTCHGNGKHKGDVALDKFASITAIQAERDTWEAVCDQLSSASMPPEEKPQPTAAEAAAITSFVNEALTFRDCTGPRDPGRVTIRRLNRAEYNNTIRDLLGVASFKPADDFPADDTGYGFDNIADVLSMSPLLAEKYLDAAEQVLAKAIVTDPPKRRAIRIEGARMTSTAGGYKNNDGWTISNNGEVFVKHPIAAAGEYEIRVRVYGIQAGPDPVRMAIKIDGQVVRTLDVKSTKEQPEVISLSAPLGAGERWIALAFLNEFTEKPQTQPSTKPQNTEKPAAAAQQPQKPKEPKIRRLTIESLSIDGPRNADKLPVPPPTEMQRKIVFALPPKDGSEQQCARQVLQKFATRAFRRPTTEDEISRMMKLFAAARADGQSYEKALKTPMAAILCAPHFLFRIEPPPPGNKEKVYAISDYALATRLSYFLWSTMPDEELFGLAAAGKLRQPGVLEAQLKRMMADPKSQAFVANFAGQWLELRILDDYEVDPKRYPDFNRDLRLAMKQEGERFFQSIITEDRSALDLIDANYTFVNERLAKFYGIPDVSGPDFRKVTLPATIHRGGVLTMAGVLTVTAMPSRTSPVKRGKYILEQILGTPPPPPPPDVPALADKKRDIEAAPLRKRLEAHRADPTCASCHKRMDPIGFALENYDAIGKWREKDGAFDIDPSGVLPSGRKIAGPDDLKKAILDKKDDFVRCLVSKMLTYATGRGTEPYDRCTIEDICASVKQNNYHVSSVLLGIIKSEAFQKRRAE